MVMKAKQVKLILIMQKKPSQLEYENRLDEIISFDAEKITSLKEAEAFINKIINFIDFIEENREYKDKIEKLIKNNRVSNLEDDLIKQGNEILSYIGILFKKAENTIQKNKLELPSENDVFEKHVNRGAYSPTIFESLGSNIDELKRKLADDSKVHIDSIKDLSFTLKHTGWDFDTLGIKEVYSKEEVKQLDKLIEKYERDRTEFYRLKQQYGLADYESLKGIYDWRRNKTMSIGMMNFLFSPLGDYLGQSAHHNSSLMETKNSAKHYQEVTISLGKRIQEIESKSYWSPSRRFGRGIFSFFKWVFGLVIKLFKPS